jgi:hypothetical protein
LNLLRPNTGLTLDHEEDAFADIGSMISHSFEFVGNPEEVGCTLQNEVVLLESRDRSSPCKHSHQVMAHFMVAYVDDVILIPDSASGFGVSVRKRLHGSLQDSSCLLAQVEDTSQDGCFGDLSNFTCGIKLNRISQASLNRHLSGVRVQGSQPQENLGNPLRAIAYALKITGN